MLIVVPHPATVLAQGSQAPKAPPNHGDRGTVEFWQNELKGKFKTHVKKLLGAPTGGIEQNGDIYIYKEEFFHPDLDQWRDLVITFSTKDSAVETFTGSGGDTKIYAVDAPRTDEVPPPASASTPLPPASVDESVVTIEGTEPVSTESYTANAGTGATGFIVEHSGRKYIATAIHVLYGEAMTEIALAWHQGPRSSGSQANTDRLPTKSRVKTSFEDFLKQVAAFPLPKVKNIGGKVLPVGHNLLFSATRDVVLLPLPADFRGSAVKRAKDAPKVGEVVTVTGNEEAAHTLNSMSGSISRIGPDRLEVDNITGVQIKPGMSGSPVCRQSTSEVLGLFAYVVEGERDWLKDDIINGGPLGVASVVSIYKLNVRNTAFRIDNLTDLKPISWPQFLTDCAIFAAMRERTLNVAWASIGAATYTPSGPVEELTPDFNSDVQIAYASFIRDWPKATDPTYRLNKMQSYLRGLEALLRKDLDDPRYQIVTPFVQKLARTTADGTRGQLVARLRAQSGKIQ